MGNKEFKQSMTQRNFWRWPCVGMHNFDGGKVCKRCGYVRK